MLLFNFSVMQIRKPYECINSLVVCDNPGTKFAQANTNGD